MGTAPDPRIVGRLLDELTSIVDRSSGLLWVAGDTLSALYGVDGARLRPPFEFAVPRGRGVQIQGHVVQRLRDVPRLDRFTIHGLPCLSGTRLLIEAARRKSSAELTVMLDCLLRDGYTSEDFLHRRIVELRTKGRRGIDHLLGVIEGAERTRGGHSYLERRFLEVLDDLGFVRPTTQPVLARRGSTLVRVDCHFDGTNIVIELLGYRFHRSKAQMQADAERINALTLSGFEVYQFTYDDVVLVSARMLATLEALSGRAAA